MTALLALADCERDWLLDMLTESELFLLTLLTETDWLILLRRESPCDLEILTLLNRLALWLPDCDMLRPLLNDATRLAERDMLKDCERLCD